MAARTGEPVDGVRRALIIASDIYADAGLKRLHAPASDARALADVLQDPGIGGFEVRTLRNEPAYDVNLAIEDFFADRRPDDLLLVHFSCHGVKDEDGELYLAMTNTKLRRLGATAVAAQFVNRCMSRSRSQRIVLLLDCCYAGAFERGRTARAGEDMGIETQFGGRGRAVITASSAVEYAFEGDELADTRELAPSVFTGALVEGLKTGDADQDQDGLVALDELYEYIYDKVRTATPNQTPGKWIFGAQGELVIARRARPVTVPAPLPQELQQGLDNPLAVFRAAAVPELQHLLHGNHAGLALAAKQALERLTSDDSRQVAATAAAALKSQAQQEQPEQEPPENAPSEPTESAAAADLGSSQHDKAPEHKTKPDNAGGALPNRTSSVEEKPTSRPKEAAASSKEQAGSSRRRSRRPSKEVHTESNDGLIGESAIDYRSEKGAMEELVKLQSVLTDLMGAVDEDARLMDSSLEDAHKLVQSIRHVMKQRVFTSGGPMDPSEYREAYDIFEEARIDENDMYELYANDLEQYQREKKDLDEVIKRRRAYISRLLAFQARFSSILDYLRARLYAD